MTILTGVLDRCVGKDVSTDELSCNKDGDLFVPYRIRGCAAGASTASATASALRGIVLIRKSEIASHGDPDGESITVTLT